MITNGSIYIEQAHLTNGQQLLLGLPDAKLPPDIPDQRRLVDPEPARHVQPPIPSCPRPEHPEDPLPPTVEQILRDDGHLVLPRLIRYIEERRRNQSRFTGAIESDPVAAAHRVGHGRPDRRPRPWSTPCWPPDPTPLWCAWTGWVTTPWSRRRDRFLAAVLPALDG